MEKKFQNNPLITRRKAPKEKEKHKKRFCSDRRNEEWKLYQPPRCWFPIWCPLGSVHAQQPRPSAQLDTLIYYHEDGRRPPPARCESVVPFKGLIVR